MEEVRCSKWKFEVELTVITCNLDPVNFTSNCPLRTSNFPCEGHMKNNDEMKGKWEQVKGRAKQAAGDLTNDERLRDEGVGDEAVGNVREGVGKARRKIGETIEDIGENLKR